MRRLPVHPNSHRGPCGKGTRLLAKNAAQKAKAGYCLSCTRATHVAVPSTFELVAFSPIKELGMSLWASDGPWADRCLAAVSCNSDSNGAPPPAGWDWAGRSSEFIAPDALLVPLPHGLFGLIPTIAEPGKTDRRSEEDLDFTSSLHDSRAILGTPADAQKLDLHMDAQAGERPLNSDTPPVAEDPSLTLDALISDTSRRVRLDKHTHLAAPSTGASKANQPRIQGKRKERASN